MAAADHPGTPSPPSQLAAEGVDHPHDFEVQKRIHRRIRNDPDYDDWEYGTEPLPHEAWVEKAAAEQATAASGEPAAGV
ncbi:hypothetical protein [Synechococcus sp. CCY 9618]|uniref:hypothetical protein n=1 Tax=Synechococcus sp. CCY 9618 TaxID=2815602 RepID=UPI001C24DA14|nr:hypothetical protein [Synechococcus sp. CCY 9618]